MADRSARRLLLWTWLARACSCGRLSRDYARVLAFTVAAIHVVHEVLHGHPTRNALINEAFVFLPIGLVWPYRRFKTLHLRHHADERLTDPFDDPESYYKALWRHEELPAAMKFLLRVNNTMAGRFVLGPWLATIGFVIGDFRQVLAGDRAIRKAWLLHGAGLPWCCPSYVGLRMPL